MAYLSMNSPVGPLTLFEEDGAIIVLEWGRADNPKPTILLEKARDQLNDYFDAKRKVFDLPLAPRGSSFQCAIWGRLSRIPYGRTQTYGDTSPKPLAAPPGPLAALVGATPFPSSSPVTGLSEGAASWVAFPPSPVLKPKKRCCVSKDVRSRKVILLLPA